MELPNHPRTSCNDNNRAATRNVADAIPIIYTYPVCVPDGSHEQIKWILFMNTFAHVTMARLHSLHDTGTLRGSRLERTPWNVDSDRYASPMVARTVVSPPENNLNSCSKDRSSRYGRDTLVRHQNMPSCPRKLQVPEIVAPGRTTSGTHHHIYMRSGTVAPPRRTKPGTYHYVLGPIVACRRILTSSSPANHQTQ